MPAKPEILVGIAGSIAVTKAPEVVSRLIEKGAGVTVLMTRAAVHFVEPAVFEKLTGRPVGLDLFDEPEEWGVGHITLPRKADAFLVVGATADLMAKMAFGMADDFVTACALVNRAPFLLAPAMHTEMWEHPATRANVATLVDRGARLIGPVDGPLSSGDSGMGRMAEPDAIAQAAWTAAAKHGVVGTLAGKHFLVTAGPTREAIDPVRFLSNPSSGKMGWALAEEAARRGAEVTLVSGPVHLPDPRGVKVVRVETALEMHEACRKAWTRADVVVAAAAVSDWRPAQRLDSKIKKGAVSESINLVPNPDILKDLAADKDKRLAVGFAAETEDLLANGEKKLVEKNLDMLVANPVGRGRGFESNTNTATLLRPGLAPQPLERMSKDDLAARILDAVEDLFQRRLAENRH